MATSELFIDGKKYIVPNEIIKNSHKHHQPDKWSVLWFYKNNRKVAVYPDQIQEDIITSKNEYQRDIFYKMCFVSAGDDCFDYYFKLKDTVPKNIVKKNKRFSKKGKRGRPKKTHGECKIRQGKVTVKFQ